MFHNELKVHQDECIILLMFFVDHFGYSTGRWKMSWSEEDGESWATLTFREEQDLTWLLLNRK